jgi:hypothetical protein
MLAATKQEVMQYLDQMEEENVIRVLLYIKSLCSQKKTPYGKFKTAEEYAKAKELRNDFEGLCQPSIIPEPYDYKKAANEARRKKHESLS